MTPKKDVLVALVVCSELRVPRRGELYVAKNGLVIKCAEAPTSRHARPRFIVKAIEIEQDLRHIPAYRK